MVRRKFTFIIIKRYLAIILLSGLHISLYSQSAALENEVIDLQKASSYENGVVTLKWEVKNPNKYKHFLVYRRMLPGLKFTEIGNILNYPALNSNSFLFEDESILEKGQYEYKIASTNINTNKTEIGIAAFSVNHIESINEEIFKYIYPSEDKKVLNMRLISNVSAEMHGGFYNNQGEVIKEVSMSLVKIGLNEFKFDTSNFETGNYLLILKIGNENIIERVNINS